MKPNVIVGVLLLIIFLGVSTHYASGHGVGFETLPPQMLGDRKVAMEVSSVLDNSTGASR